MIGGLLASRASRTSRKNDGDRASNEKAASAAATAAAETIFSYQFNKLDEHLTDSKKLMTSKFAKEFEKIAPALDDIAPQRQVQVQAVGRNAAALSCGDECSPGTVNVLVFLDQARLVDGSKQPDVIGNRITMKMVHRDGNGSWTTYAPSERSSRSTYGLQMQRKSKIFGTKSQIASPTNWRLSRPALAFGVSRGLL